MHRLYDGSNAPAVTLAVLFHSKKVENRPAAFESYRLWKFVACTAVPAYLLSHEHADELFSPTGCNLS